MNKRDRLNEVMTTALHTKLTEDNNKMSNEQGKCPFCGSMDLEYETLQTEDGDMVYYPWTCTSCGHKGEEWYNLTFVGHNVEDNDGNMVEVN